MKKNKLLFFIQLFNIDFDNISHPMKKYFEDYIFIKIIKISLTYAHYYKYFKDTTKLIESKEYFENY